MKPCNPDQWRGMARVALILLFLATIAVNGFWLTRDVLADGPCDEYTTGFCEGYCTGIGGNFCGCYLDEYFHCVCTDCTPPGSCPCP